VTDTSTRNASRVIHIERVISDSTFVYRVDSHSCVNKRSVYQTDIVIDKPGAPRCLYC
jgi:hypothetical protein